MATELQDNSRYRLFKELVDESKAVTIASVALIVSVLSLLMAFMALNDAKHAKIQVDLSITTMQKDIERLNDQNEVTQIYLRDFKSQQKGDE